MTNTEKRHWVNGIRRHGYRFVTVSYSIHNLGIMLCYGIGMPYINLYKLQ
jgi:hypothetical protein